VFHGLSERRLQTETSCHRSFLDGDSGWRLSDPSSLTVPIMFLAGDPGGFASISMTGAVIDP
jgi:hypothetical protein